MNPYILPLDQIDRTRIAIAGGKAARLGELARLPGITVPPGLCLTTHAFARLLAESPSARAQLARLDLLPPGDPEALDTAAALRRTIEALPLPAGLAAALDRPLARLAAAGPCAVRSSATAEDLPTASFAGQHDSYLNVTGPAALLTHIRRCWASLFTTRAIAYRLRHGIPHRHVRMAVLIQQMVDAGLSGVLFTADPVSGHRGTVAVEAAPGLGEALVSGRVPADSYQLRDGVITARAIAPTRALPLLSDPQLHELARLGRRVEAHFGAPQDIEWCLAGGRIFLLQSRPITTLFPVPVNPEPGPRVYLSVGHQQMMTDALKPLGRSLWQLTAARPMYEAGGRLFVDVTPHLASAAGRAGLLNLAGKSDPLTGDALRTLFERPGFLPPPADGAPAPPLPTPAPLAADPALVPALIARSRDSLALLQRQIRSLTGPALLDFIEADLREHRQHLLHPPSLQVIMAAVDASWWLNTQLEDWLGEKNAADTLTLSVPHNITSQMGLDLLDVADAIRPHPEVVAFLERAPGDGFLDELPHLPGGVAARAALAGWLDRYGMRCAGEIDITRPRWSERPSLLLPLLLANIRNAEPGAARRRFAEGLRAAARKERELLDRLQSLPGGDRLAAETRQRIEQLRTFIGYREYPKYALVARYFVYKQALFAEAAALAAAGVLREPEAIFYLTFPELQDLVRTRRADDELLLRRREEFRCHESLTPPRVLTSEGETIAGTYRRGDLPPGALAGIAVSAGVVEGRARVRLDLAGAILEPGDILVTTYTDPSWTPLFVGLRGLVTEVGGLMTHGAVIAREYGLPAVVGVEHATRRIRDGQRIRIHGTEGYVEILAAGCAPRPEGRGKE